ncbi:MAG: SUF system NifU family Fe-S cluster assembly protein [Acidaminococcaceae bacterium]|nr:SUF system NifU family Fe-S cluster assembly protein [Acidaminococcaceae bacterium]
MSGLSDIYTELVAEESRNTEHRRHLSAPTCCEHGHNPSCGDDITLELEVREGRVEDASFTGSGCAISQASASIMIGLVKGQTVEKARRLAALFQQMIREGTLAEEELEELEEAAALQSISRMPARVKCALLSWRTLDAALGRDAAPKQ